MSLKTFLILLVLLVLAGGGLYVYYTQYPQELQNLEESQNQDIPTIVLGGDNPDGSHMPNPYDADAPAVATVRAFAAAQAGTDVLATVVLSATPQDWPDGCLGLGGPDELCTQAIVPGYRVVVSVNGANQTYRTNTDGTVVVQEL